MIKEKMTVTNKIGLHARAAAKFVEVTNKYDADIEIRCQNGSIDGKSIMGILALGISQGETIEVIADGLDEEEAMDGIRELLDKGLENL
jgi:phosphotransferase system HPr (HPr) family protein